MISVEEALARLLAPLEALPAEQISVADAPVLRFTSSTGVGPGTDGSGS